MEPPAERADQEAGLSAEGGWKSRKARPEDASGLVAAGRDVVTVQRAMGHASATTTLSTYAHLWPTVEDKTRAAASGMAAAALANQTRSADSQS